MKDATEDARGRRVYSYRCRPGYTAVRRQNVTIVALRTGGGGHDRECCRCRRRRSVMLPGTLAAALVLDKLRVGAAG